MDKKDKKLLKQLLRGERKAFGMFYRQTQIQAMALAVKKTAQRKDAEEVVHDAYLSFLDSLPIFRGGSSLKTFLFSILRHELADYWRKRYAKKAIRTVPFIDQVYTEQLYSAKQMAMVIERVFNKLRPWEAKILRMKYEEEMSVARIAEVMGWSIKAAESRLFRARKAFQLAYETTESV